MDLVHNRYRLEKHLCATLYGGVYLCEDVASACGGASTSPRSVVDVAIENKEPKQHVEVAAGGRRVVLKQTDIAQAMHMLNTPNSQQQTLDDPRQEKAVANLLRRTGGHANVVQYYDDFILDRTLFFVMEYCSDGDLYEYLHTHGKTRLAQQDAMSVLAQVASGVAFLHAHDIAHRDLSMENVLLHEGVCKIGDFGLSTRTTRPSTERVGKAYYMAPEVVAGVAYDAKAADMWSLGILLFIMLTGSPLVPIASSSDMAFRAVERLGVGAVLDAWGVSHTISQPVRELLSGMVQVQPAARLTIEQVLRHEAFDEWEASFAQTPTTCSST
ncbi:Serine/threonine protein kinase, partial [Globisporangium splendens]